MSMELSGSFPRVTAWCEFDGSGISISGCTQKVIKIPHDDMCFLIMYYLTNTDLNIKDHRLPLIKDIKKLKKVRGFMLGKKRLAQIFPVKNKRHK